MFISVDQLRRMSISTWRRVIGASVVCLLSAGAILLLKNYFGGTWLWFTAVPLMFITFLFAGLSLIMTWNYHHVLNRGEGRDQVLDSDSFFRRLIIREEIK